MNKNNIVTKHNNLVTKVGYKITQYEHLVLLSALSCIDSRQVITDKQFYEVDIDALITAAELTSTTAYSELKKAVAKLSTRQISVLQDDNTVRVMSLIQSYEYHDNRRSLGVRFNRDIIPFISSLRSSFVSYRFRHIARFNSSHSFKLYELLLKEADLSSVKTLDLDYLLFVLGLGASYKRFSNLEARVLKPAVADLNQYSDLTVTYEKVKRGRSVIGVRFHIEDYEPREPTAEQIASNAFPGESSTEARRRIRQKKKSFLSRLFS